MKKITSFITHLDRNNHNHFGAHLSKPSAKMDTLTTEKKTGCTNHNGDRSTKSLGQGDQLTQQPMELRVKGLLSLLPLLINRPRKHI